MYCVKFCGFKEAYVPITKEKREIGTSGYNIIKGIVYAVKVMVFSSNRLLLIPVFSTFFLLFTVFVLPILLLSGIIDKISIEFITVLAVFLAFILCLNISILGVYIGMIAKEISTRPHYIINKIYKKG